METAQPSGRAPGQPIERWASIACGLILSAVSVSVEVARAKGFSGPASGTIRGLLGERLREMRCITRSPTCDGCLETARCDYARVFLHRTHRDGAHGDHEVVPLWLRGIPVVRELEAGAFEAEVVAVDDARAALPFLEVALRDALRRALGPSARVGVGKHREVRLAAEAPRAPRRSLLARTPLAIGGDLERCRADCPEAPWLPALVRAAYAASAASPRPTCPAPKISTWLTPI